MARTAWLALSIAAVCSSAPLAHAQDEGATVRLDWPSTGECMSEESARAAVIERLGRDPFREGGPSVLGLSVTCRTEGSGTVVRFELRAPDGTALGERELHVGARCRRIDREIAIVLALLIESQASTVVLTVPDPPEPAPEPEPTPAPEPSTPGPAPSVPEEPPATPPPVAHDVETSLVIHASIGAALGTVAPGVLIARVGAGWASELFDVRIALGATFGGPLGGGPSVDASAALVALTGCVGSDDDVRVEGCIDVEAGLAFARGVSLASPQNNDSPWLAVATGIGVDFRLGSGVVLDTALEAAIPVVRPVFTIEPTGAVAHEPWAIAPTLRAGISGHWRGGP